MTAEDMEYKKVLLQAMDKAEQARIVRALAGEWLDSYQEGIIGRLKTCPASAVMALRNQLVALEVFKSWLDTKIENGELAKADLEELEEQSEHTVVDNWYDHL